ARRRAAVRSAARHQDRRLRRWPLAQCRRRRHRLGGGAGRAPPLTSTAMDHPHSIIRLARAFGLQVGYLDYTGSFRGADLDVLRPVLQALGAAVDDDGGEAQLEERELSRWRTMIEPVIVAWDGVATIELRVAEHDADRPIALRLRHELGDVVERTIVPSE